MVGRLYKTVIRYFKPVGDTQYATCVLCDKSIKYARKDSTLFPECMLSHMSRIHPHIHINKATAEKNSDPTKSLFHTKPQMSDLNPLPLELQTLSKPLVNVYPLEERPARTAQHSLRPGASYQLSHVVLLGTGYGYQQLWTLVDTGTGDQHRVWAPKSLTRHTENGYAGLNVGAVGVLKHATLEYKGFTVDASNIPHYTFRITMPVTSTPTPLVTDTPKQPPPLFAPHTGEVKNA